MGNSLKAGIRESTACETRQGLRASIGRQDEAQYLTYGLLLAGFVAFDTFKSLLQDQDGKISGPKTVIAGFGAGVTESLLAVTPFESIKTQLFVFSVVTEHVLRVLELSVVTDRPARCKQDR